MNPSQRRSNITMAACFLIVVICVFSLLMTRGVKLDGGSGGACPTDVSIVVIQPERFSELLTTTTTIPLTPASPTTTSPTVTLNTVPALTSTTGKAKATTTTRKAPTGP